MTKFLLLVICFLIIGLISEAQDYPDFGLPSKEDIDLKECLFEKEATAVVLMHEAFSYSEDDQHLVTTQHIKIKILKQSGVNYANISIPFYRINYFESITDLEAYTLNVGENGNIVKQKLNKKAFYTSKINDLLGKVSFAFPSVKVGSIIEYQYRSVMGNYWGLRDWYFQENIPVIISRYHLKTIFTKKFSYKVFKSPGIEYTESPEKDRIFFEMRNIPSLTVEPYMDAKEDYLQRANFHVGNYNSRWSTSQVSEYKSSWKLLNSEMLYNKFFGGQIRRPIEGTSDFIDSIKQLKLKEAKMNKIYAYVKNQMTWNEAEDFLSDDVSRVWKKKTGSAGDINMILINLLNAVKLEVYPLLVSKRYNGKVDTSYPYSNQFNFLMACVNINGKKYILDATEKFYTSRSIPESVLNTTGFMVDRISGELLTIVTDSITYKQEVSIDMQVKHDSIISGLAVIKNFDYAKIKKLKIDTIKLKEQYLQQKNFPLKISKFEFSNNNVDSESLDEKINFTTPLNGSGEYKFIPVNLFVDFGTNPFISERRFSDINFGYNRSLSLNVIIKIPEDFIVEELPVKILPDTLEKDIIFFCQTTYNKETNMVIYNLNIEFNQSYFEAKDYLKFKNKYKKIFDILDNQIILKKK